MHAGHQGMLDGARHQQLRVAVLAVTSLRGGIHAVFDVHGDVLTLVRDAEPMVVVTLRLDDPADGRVVEVVAPCRVVVVAGVVCQHRVLCRCT